MSSTAKPKTEDILAQDDYKNIALKVNAESITTELKLLFAAHHAVGLKGKMLLYTTSDQKLWRSQEAGMKYWIGPDDIDNAVKHIVTIYNNGELPNSTLLLNPMMHEVNEYGEGTPLGSGVFWATSFALGIYRLNPDQKERIDDLKQVYNSLYVRGENHRAGLKMLGFSNRILSPEELADVGKALYDLVDLENEPYWPYYPLSSINYLCLHGMFGHPSIHNLIPDLEITEDFIKANQMDVKEILDARYCWDSYDRHHSLYMKWGRDPANVAHNNRFFSLCARDIMLFDRTGPMRSTAEEKFEFLVPGWLPRGAITVLAASGGTGKSSIAHELCVMAAMDPRPDDKPQYWLGQPLNREYCNGVCVYFSGEDGPGIINARAELFDPEKRAMRLQFHRADFGGEDISFADFVSKRLMKMPDVPILVIDPARKYLSGDEDDSEVVSNFFLALEEFAMEKKATVVVVHHLQKGAMPKSIPEVLHELRGSQVFIDRARCVIGMYRDSKYTVVGLAKNNIPPNLGMVMGERVFVRNPKNLRLVWLPGQEGVRADTLSQEELDRIELEAFKQQVEMEGTRAKEMEEKIRQDQLKAAEQYRPY